MIVQCKCNDCGWDYYSEFCSSLRSEDKFLSVRMLLELNEELLTKHKFSDVWRKEKEIENLKALELLEGRIDELDQIQDTVDRWHEIFRGKSVELYFILSRPQSINRFHTMLLHNFSLRHRNSRRQCF